VEIPGSPGVVFLQPLHIERSASAEWHTLINKGWFNRFFEVTADGAVVWEYVNPYFGGSPRPQEQTNQVFRAYRYMAAEIARAQAAT
jgi:hypothetical protein